MAQEMLKHLRPEVGVFSRGLYADPNYEIPQKVLSFLQKHHIVPSTHLSTQLSEADLAAADCVFFMEQAHLDQVLDRFAQYTDKCYLLSEFATGQAADIPDPIGLTGRAFEKQAEVLKRLVNACADLIF